MSTKTKIEWTDVTWNPVRGCSRVSEGCRNCYAERQAARFGGSGMAYEGLVRIANGQPQWTGKVSLAEKTLSDPYHWKNPRRVFVNSMSDLFHENVPINWILRIFNVMAQTPRHTYQVLTKRPQRMKYLLAYGEKMRCESAEHHRLLCAMPLPNVWLGVSVEDQKTADERVPLLLGTPAAVRWVSYEPALGPVDFTRLGPDGSDAAGWNVLTGAQPCCHEHPDETIWREHLDWLVCGGESGPGARPMHPDWARSVRDHCQAAGVPFFFKQFGEFSPDHSPTEPGHKFPKSSRLTTADGAKRVIGVACSDLWMHRVGKKRAGRLLDGREWNEYPERKGAAQP